MAAVLPWYVQGFVVITSLGRKWQYNQIPYKFELSVNKFFLEIPHFILLKI